MGRDAGNIENHGRGILKWLFDVQIDIFCASNLRCRDAAVN